MKSALLAAVAVTILMSTPAAAQMYCDRPIPPRVPWSADEDLEWAEISVRRYVQEMQDYQECLASEASDAEFEAQTVIRDWNLLVSSGG